MGTIHDYKNRDQYHEGMPNTVISVAKVDRYAVKYTNSEGKETMCLVDCFGKLADGELGIFIIANEREMTERLRRPGPNQLAQIRGKIADMIPSTMDELPGDPVPGVAEALDDVVPADGEKAG